MAMPEDLQGYTVERLRELCAERSIPVHLRRKEELIAALMGSEQEMDAANEAPASGDGNVPYTADLLGLILQMQRQQMAWMGDQQRN